MKTIIKLSELTTVAQLEAFLQGSQPCAYTVHSSKDECYQWVQGTLVQFRYMTLGKGDKGVVIRYLMKISGYSRQQLTRLIGQYVKSGKSFARSKPETGFRGVIPQRIFACWPSRMNCIKHLMAP